MNHNDPATWMVAQQVAQAISPIRASVTVKVNVDGILVPVVSAGYDPTADAVVIELARNQDYKIALSTTGLDDAHPGISVDAVGQDTQRMPDYQVVVENLPPELKDLYERAVTADEQRRQDERLRQRRGR